MDDVTLQWLLPDGRGAGRSATGSIVRVAGGVPGDVVGVDTNGSIHRLADSPDRRAPPCPHSARCGGCDLDALSPAARLSALASMVAHTLRFEDPPEIIASPRSAGHRARIKLALEDGRVGYRAPRSHDLVEIDVCGIARPEIGAALPALRRWVADAPSPTGLASVELRSDGTRVVYHFTSSGSVPRAVRESLGTLGDVALDGRRLAGDPVIHLEVLGHRLQVRPRSFYQVNLEANALLVATVRDALVARGIEAVVDLYAGIGNLSVPVAAAGPRVVAVEAPGSGAEDLRDNARHHPQLQAIGRRVERFDPSRVPFDAVILDPPRSGAPGILPRVARNRPRVIVYVSCHAPSAARDIAQIPDYRLTDLTVVDLFVDTRHVEAVAILERTRGGRIR